MNEEKKKFFQIIQGKLPSERQMRNKLPGIFKNLKKRLEAVKDIDTQGIEVTKEMFPKLTYLPAYMFENCPISEVDMPQVTAIAGAFTEENNLERLYLPNCELVESGTNGVHNRCTILDLPKCKEIEREAFWGERGLVEVNLPELTTLGNSALRFTGLTSVSLPKLTSVEAYSLGQNYFTSDADVYIPLITSFSP